MTGFNWTWIALMAAVPCPVAMLIAWPIWRSKQMILGSLAGTAVIFSTAIGLIMREYMELDAMTQRCLAAGTTCWPEPAPFTRFAVYAFIGLVEVFVLFAVGSRVEERIRNQAYAPEWR